ncbi:MAG: ArnT family glycosyltransferase [Micromonosporaceae bacterium]
MYQIMDARTNMWAARLGEFTRGVPSWLLLTGVLLLATACWAVLQTALPYLGHDEAVYAGKARSWLTGDPAPQWDPRRAPGMPALGYLALAVHPSAGAVRLAGLVLLLGTMAVVYAVGAAWIGRVGAAVASVVVLAGTGFFRRTPEFLSDIASAGLLLAVAYFLVRAQERPRSPALLAAPVCALAALYVRYGALAGLGALGLAAVVVWGPRAWLAQGRWLVGAIAIFVGGLVPHLVYATKVTGSPFGLLVAAGESASPGYVGDGLVYYVASFPFGLAGPLGGVVMAAGLVAGGLAARRLLRDRLRRESDPGRAAEDRRTVFLALTAVLLAVLLGFTAHGEPRFVFLSVIVLTILGVRPLARWAGRWGRRSGSSRWRRWSPAMLPGIGVLALVSLPLTYAFLAPSLARTTQARASLVALAERFQSVGGQGPARPAVSGPAVSGPAVSGPAESGPAESGPAGSAEGRECVLVSSYQPELGWYSGCATAAFWQARQGALPAAGVASYVLFANGRDQPSEAQIRSLADDRPIEVVELVAAGSLGRVRILTVR